MCAISRNERAVSRIVDSPRFLLIMLLGLLVGGCRPDQPAAATYQVGYALGEAGAPVTVMEFSDFGCPFCAMFARGTYPELHREFVETGRIRWVYVPFVVGTFPNGGEAARAAECAAEQRRFWEMKDRIYAGQREWRTGSRPASIFAAYAREIGLDSRMFETCYRENRGRERTIANNNAAAILGVRATPTFVIGGRIIEGALPIARFRQILEGILAAEADDG